MAVLSNYPNVSQLSAKVNPLFDCVPSAIVDGLEYLTGQHIDIDAMVTACYGPNWHGATSASRYVEFCAQHGVRLYPIDGDNAALVADLHQQIQAGHPCLLTEPDVYAPAHPDWSHVLSVYGETPGTLTARDPFSTHDVEHSDAEWAGILEYREIWVMEALIVELSIDMAAHLFRQLDANHWQSIATGRILQFGLLNDYKANGAASLDYLGDVISPEIVQANGDVAQFYASGARLWQKSTGKVLPFDLLGQAGQDILRQLLSVPAPAPEVPQEHADMLQIKEIVAKY